MPISNRRLSHCRGRTFPWNKGLIFAFQIVGFHDMLPSGLASISARLDDTPNVRGAVAFGMAQAKKREGVNYTQPRVAFDPVAEAMAHQAEVSDRFSLGSAIDRHAALAIGSAYRSADRR